MMWQSTFSTWIDMAEEIHIEKLTAWHLGGSRGAYNRLTFLNSSSAFDFLLKILFSYTQIERLVNTILRT